MGTDQDYDILENILVVGRMNVNGDRPGLWYIIEYIGCWKDEGKWSRPGLWYIIECIGSWEDEGKWSRPGLWYII